MKVMIWIFCIIVFSVVRVLIGYALDTLGFILSGFSAGLLAVAQFSAVWFCARHLCEKWETHKKKRSEINTKNKNHTSNSSIHIQIDKEEELIPKHDLPVNTYSCSKCEPANIAELNNSSVLGNSIIRNKLVPIFVLVAISVVVLAVGIYFVRSNIEPNQNDNQAVEQNYEKAYRMYLAGDYTNASLAFKEMGDYKDAPQKVIECNDAIVIHYADSASYGLLQSFLEENEISVVSLTHIKTTALNSITQKNYYATFKLLPMLIGSPDLHQEVQEALYCAGWVHYVNKEYDVSNEIFGRLGTYKDSAQLIDYEVVCKDAQKVTMGQLKANPQKYDEKEIQVNAVVWTVGEFFYIVDREYYDEHPNDIYMEANFEETPYLYVIRNFSCQISPDYLQCGAEVTIVGQFVYDAIGEEYITIKDGVLQNMIRTQSEAELMAEAIFLS
jgi:hypothetical protein